YGGCPAAAVCTIPADSLEWGSYTITLRVTAASQEWDDRVRTVTVANGAIQPSFGWIPTSPSIGESTVFQIQGVQGDIDRATWTMGGVGCDGASATQVCTPSQFNNCKALAFKYASGGNKVVGLTVRINGVDYVDGRLASERTVTVANTGSCDGGGGPVCTYSLSDDGANFGPNGGDGAFTVFTGSTCRWTATENLGWLRITSGASGTGTGTVRYAVDANSGPARSGSILAGGRFYGVNQEAPDVPANFVMSNPRPAIGEAVTFSVDPILQVLSWDFGEKDCRGHNSFIDCRFLPQSSCNEIEWSFPTAGDKPVTMVLSDGRTQTKVPTVRPVGECCLADRSPLASFTVSTDEPYVGEEVVFTDTSAKALTAKALGFSWTPTIPTIGELTTFTLSAVTGEVASATWNFGGGGCGGASATVTCSPGLFNNCTGQTFKYATAGDKQVSVTVQLVGGGSQSAGPRTVTVANTGSCDGGGGGGCSYSLSPISADFPPAGGNGAFNVSTAAGCAWTASTSAAWIGLGTASGSGSGVVSYTVTGHSGTSDRSGTILVQGRTHTVRQQAPAPDLDSDPTWWRWTVSLELEGGALEEVATSSERVFRYAFAGPGTYRVSLEAGNCVGSSTETTTLMVLESPIEDFVVGAAVKVSGANDTRWETDLRFHNPCGEPLDVRIEFEPEGENNSQASLFFREFVLAPAQTRVFADITEAIPGLVGEELSGSVRIISGSDSGCKVLSVSRTYNSTPDGTLGLFVPALPVKRAENELLDLTGLARNSAYRSNLRLVNYGDADVWVPLRALDRFGEPISNPREALVPGHSTKQINDVAGWLGVSGDLAPFSVRAEVEGLQVQAYATVVDNQTGDSVLFMSSFSGDNRVWVSGVASNSGVNDSRWRTDLWLYNPTTDWLAGELDFVVGTKPDEVYGFSWPELKTQRVRDYLDLVGDELNLEEKSGYLVLTGEDGGPAPQVAARTYNLALDGGTYGLGLRTFADGDLLKLGETAYIVGVSNSADQSLGFRTNLALLNTDENFWIGVRLTLIDLSGAAVGEPLDLMLAPGVLRQFDLAERFGVAELTGTASLEIEVTAGNGLAAYATEIDNRTQDAIFIPAQRKVMGAPN
ncbi:MAG: hypothetical protein MUE90_11430, partial [Thermoanaerobaculales bacterium]|nr:hypothetical protein [Thermoanaerobaculales bacterium]